MMRFLVLSALVALATADVNSLFRNGNGFSGGNNNKFYQPNIQKPYRSLPVAPVSRPLPVAPISRPLPVAPIPYSNGPAVAILRSDSNINPDGSYEYGYETANGISAQEQGQQKQLGEESGNTAQGSYQYTSPEGVPVVVQYIADENGFQPASDLLPTPPPVPAAILRALEYIAAHPQPEQPASNGYGGRFKKGVYYH